MSSAETVADVCRGFTVVISAFNPGWKNPDIYDDTLKIYSGYSGGGEKSRGETFFMRGWCRLFVYRPWASFDGFGFRTSCPLPGVKAMGDFYLNVLCREKEIDWVFLSPAADMRPGKRTGKFRIGKDNLIEDERRNSAISVEDYAVAMLNELEKPAHHRERFTIGY